MTIHFGVIFTKSALATLQLKFLKTTFTVMAAIGCVGKVITHPMQMKYFSSKCPLISSLRWNALKFAYALVQSARFSSCGFFVYQSNSTVNIHIHDTQSFVFIVIHIQMYIYTVQIYTLYFLNCFDFGIVLENTQHRNICCNEQSHNSNCCYSWTNCSPLTDIGARTYKILKCHCFIRLSQLVFYLHTYYKTLYTLQIEDVDLLWNQR